MSGGPLPTKLADLTPNQLHTLQDYTQSVNERAAQLFPGQKPTTLGQMLRSRSFRNDYEVLTTTPDRHKRGEHKAGSPLAIALETIGYRPANADWDVGDTPTFEDEGGAEAPEDFSDDIYYGPNG